MTNPGSLNSMSDQIAAQPSLLRRPHTVLGVCEGLGEDFGFNPVYLRVAIAGGLYFAPLAVIGSYLFLGAALAVARWAYPVPAAAAAAPQQAASSANSDSEELRIAA
jgi:phage shock protein PspC (stress-responsive transcriptional regulator)